MPHVKILIQHATIVNEGSRRVGSLLVSDGRIEQISYGHDLPATDAHVLDAAGAYVLPGAIDSHVHMREPGLTHKATMQSESRAAVAGGVTSVMDMPNTVPQTTSVSAWEDKMQQAARTCHANYAFYLGATDSNLPEILRLDWTRSPGVKVFMGASTGNMLLDDEPHLRQLFAQCPTLLMTHCEDSARINARMAEVCSLYGEDPDVIHHPDIRDEEACTRSSELAVRLARESGARLHVAHISTARELQLFSPADTRITAEACVPHLLFDSHDYARLGTRIKCNPAIKQTADRDALRAALSDGRISTVSTDHAPHLLTDKAGGCRRAASGMPMVQFSLPAMLTLASQGVLSMERVVELMCHNQALIFGIAERGFLREGFRADIALVRPVEWRVERSDILSLCGWSPLEGATLKWRVEHTWVNGIEVWDGRSISEATRGQALHFER